MSATRVGINGFGRIGRLALVHINDFKDDPRSGIVDAPSTLT